MIIVRMTMNVIIEKQKEVVQTLLSMIEPMNKEKGCMSFHVFQDIGVKTVFSLIEEWESREDLDRHMLSDIFSVLLGTKSLLCKPLKIQIHTVSHSEGMNAVIALRSKKKINLVCC
jgi:quinol monooxygenase YgiN